MIFQIFLVVFALFAIAKTYKQYKKKQQSLHWFSIFTIFWVIVILVAFLPQTTDVIARYVGVERGADLIVYIAVVVISYALYRVFVRLQKQNKELTDLVRKIAILEVKKGKNNHE